MHSSAQHPEDYIESLTDERRQVIKKIRKVILDNLPKGFEEGMTYGMLSYHVPHSFYPAGYHVDPKQPLPFINLASQKNHVALYHMGLYADPQLLKWFVEEYPKHSEQKLDMGKSCIRFKKTTHIPYRLLGELFAKVTPGEWVSTYERVKKR